MILPINIAMQDLYSISRAGGGGLFGKQRPTTQNHHHYRNHEALKCPRCDSVNTKFCYYNNYNLSQPRHFCKNCRRYWTKGGVLRNVPVGGGCRKTKRSSRSKSAVVASSSSYSSAKAMATSPKSDRNSIPLSKAETVSVLAPSSTELLNVESSKTFYSNLSLEVGSEDEIGNLTSFINSSLTTTSFSEAIHFGIGYGNSMMSDELNGNQTVHDRSDMNGEFFGLINDGDWKGGENQHNHHHIRSHHHQGLFDLSNADIIDQAYWSENQWTDKDHPSV